MDGGLGTCTITVGWMTRKGTGMDGSNQDGEWTERDSHSCDNGGKIIVGWMDS